MTAGSTPYDASTHNDREYHRGLFDLIAARDGDCNIVIRRVNGPAEPDAFYWHLYCKGDKVNGGLVEGTVTDAEDRAKMYRHVYARNAVLASYLWDNLVAAWIPKNGLNYG